MVDLYTGKKLEKILIRYKQKNTKENKTRKDPDKIQAEENTKWKICVLRKQVQGLKDHWCHTETRH